jgi:hypothetical protein
MIFLSSILLTGMGSTTYPHAQGQPSDQFPESIVAFSNTDNTPHSLKPQHSQNNLSVKK